MRDLSVKLFTHTDLDGIGCAVLVSRTFETTDITFCNYDEINHEVRDFIANDGINEFDLVLITDVSVDDKTASELDFYSCYDKIFLLDHHKTAERLNKYSWCYVNEHEEVKKDGRYRLTCGTNLLYEFLISNKYTNPSVETTKFVELVRQWDTWEWANFYDNNEKSKDLNSLVYLLGRYTFIDRFSKNISTDFNDEEIFMLNKEKEEFNKLVNNKMESLIEHDMEADGKVYNVGVVSCNTNVSMVGNELAKNNKHLDFIILINTDKRSLSFRARQGANVDLSIIASKFGGGGHPYAAGATITDDRLFGALTCLLEID